MPRPAKPYIERDWYASRAGGEYIKLCPKLEGMAKAKTILRKHLKQRKMEREHNGGRLPPTLTVPELFALFLEAVEKEKSNHTFLDYKRWCVEFAQIHRNRKARDLTRFDAQQFKQHMLAAVVALCAA
jgi:hypothetical protein